MATAAQAESMLRRRGHRLCRAGWALFALSLALPAVRVVPWDTVDPSAAWLSGWECFRGVALDAWQRVLGHPVDSLYMSGFAVANAVFLASVFAAWRFRRDLRWLRRSSLAVGAAALYAASLPVYGGVAFRDLAVGYSAWVASFVLVAAGMLQLSIRRSRAPMDKRARVSRTPEEMAAIRELEEFLHGSDNHGPA